MYLVELKPGMEAIYASVAEFTEAVRRGEVNEYAKVFHRTRSQWVPITAHPKFREIVAGMTGPIRKQWTFLPAKPGEEVASPAPVAAPAAASTPNRASTATHGKTASRRGWRLVFGGMLGRHSG
jgi:hypothetical protein